MRQVGKENNARAKTRFDRDAGEIQRLKDANAELQTQMESLTKELEEVKTRSQEAAASGAAVDPGLAHELEALRTEKASLEQALAKEQAAHLVSSAQVSEQAATLLRAERDTLLEEKAKWTATGEAPTEGSADQGQWQVERAELIKARDEAAARAQDLSAEVTKAREDAQSARLASDKFQTRIQEISKARMAESSRAAEELKKLRDEMQTVASAGSSEETAKHAEELRALEERLVKKHEEELKAALEAAKASAAAPPPDTQAAIDAALATYKEQLKEEHAKAIDDAVERGRKEAAARAKLKDQQLVKAQSKVKELETRILALEGAGGITASTSAPAATPAPAAPAASPSTSAPHAAGAGKPGPAAHLPPKPNTVLRGVGRGRGVPPTRGISIRGAAPGAAGRGAVTAAAAEAAAANGGPASVKRTREGDAVADDTATKRQKQGEAAAAGAHPHAGPVRLRRPGPGGPSGAAAASTPPPS
ncbi:hypothetical protein L226DRAFT_326433 [Lentinus tigrinus ALCF2SS1-7]|uniref:uncharacterized protein n=1 Tax=Lentinus tigrinus ALCF2SS1-7 TaxID=1328758 RepID=UPI0011660B63|nr:hypothetical protein L226DRAFT_326433 [Lentinus tigrinus ALCF2SS1-7]